MKKQTCSQSAFTLVEIMIIVGIIGFLAVIAVPNFIRARGRSQAVTCINNLRQIGSATTQWALENKRSGTAQVLFSDIRDYLRGEIVCPAGGTCFDDSYTITNASSAPVCQKVPIGDQAHTMPEDVSR